MFEYFFYFTFVFLFYVLWRSIKKCSIIHINTNKYYFINTTCYIVSMEKEPLNNIIESQPIHEAQKNNVTHDEGNPHQHNEGYNSYIAKDGNLVWAGAMTLAWRSLCYYANVNELDVSQGGEAAKKFNKSKFSSKDLQEKSYYIKSGLGVQTIRAINKQRNEKFPECSFPPLTEDVNASTVISYAYLYKQIPFPIKFSCHHKPYFEFRGKTKSSLVVSFQAYGKQQFNQILLLQYEERDDFLVMIAGIDQVNEIYIMKSRDDNLDVKGAIERVINSSIKEGSRYLNNIDDKFEVPILDLDYEYDHPDLTGAQLLNFQNKEISKIKQGLKLKLDEEGAKVQNYGQMYTDQCAIVNPNERIIVCDTPFWVLMREKGKHPYLCVKINDL